MTHPDDLPPAKHLRRQFERASGLHDLLTWSLILASLACAGALAYWGEL